MAIKVRSFLPSEGWHKVQIADIYAEYDVVTKHGFKDYVWFVLMLENGKELKQRYGLSFHRNSYLYPIVKGLLGTEPREDMDLEVLIGVDCEVEVKHSADESGKIWVNVVNARQIRQVFQQGEIE